jgi:hypothetical protein
VTDTFQVKPLEWRDAHPGPAFCTHTILGTYFVCALTQLMPARHIVWRWKLTVDGKYSEAFDSADAAKAALQAHYMAALMPALLCAEAIVIVGGGI